MNQNICNRLQKIFPTFKIENYQSLTNSKQLEYFSRVNRLFWLNINKTWFIATWKAQAKKIQIVEFIFFFLLRNTYFILLNQLYHFWTIKLNFFQQRTILSDLIIWKLNIFYYIIFIEVKQNIGVFRLHQHDDLKKKSKIGSHKIKKKM